MSRVNGDMTCQVGSAWLADTPPLWLTESLPDWLLGRTQRGDDLDVDASVVRSTIARSTSVLRRLAKGRAA